jgi:hypothetical protein
LSYSFTSTITALITTQTMITICIAIQKRGIGFSGPARPFSR